MRLEKVAASGKGALQTPRQPPVPRANQSAAVGNTGAYHTLDVIFN